MKAGMRNFLKLYSLRWLALLVAGLCLIPILAFGGLSMILYSIAQKQSAVFCENILKGSSYNEERITSATKEVFDSINFDSAIFDLINSKVVEPNKLLSGLRQLKAFQQTNYFIDSIYVYNAQNKSFYVSSPNSPEAVYTLDSFYDIQAADIMQNYFEYKNMQPVFRKLSVSYPSIDNLEMVSFMRYNTLSPKGESSVVMINIQINSLLERGYFPLENMDTSLILTSNVGEIYHHFNSNGSDLLNEAAVTKVFEEKNSDGTFVFKDNGANNIVCYRTAFNGYWTLIFTANQSQLFALLQTNSSFVLIMLFAIMFMVLVACCIIVFKNIAKAQKASSQKIEEAEKKQREEALENKRQAILRYLNGVDKGFESLLQPYDKSFEDNNSLRVAIFVIDNYITDVAQNYSAKECSALKYGVCNIANELLPNVVFCTYENDARCVAVLNDNADLPKKNYTFFVATALKALNVSVSVFLSEIGEASQLSRSYESLCAALPYKQLLGKQSFITAEMIAEREAQVYLPPEAKIRNITQEILNTNIVCALQLINEFLCEISQCSHRSFQRALLHLLFSTDEALELIKRNNMLDEMLYTEAIVHSLGLFESVDEIYSMLEHILLHMEQLILRKSADKHILLLNSIRKSVEEGFCSIDFSVNNIADTVKLSPAYVGRIFKRATGVTLVEYILEVRMDEARKLLQTTNLSIVDIVSKVGFSDVPYFYKVFKKSNGCTPASYRSSSRK